MNLRLPLEAAAWRGLLWSRLDRHGHAAVGPNGLNGRRGQSGRRRRRDRRHRRAATRKLTGPDLRPAATATAARREAWPGESLIVGAGSAHGLQNLVGLPAGGDLGGR